MPHFTQILRVEKEQKNGTSESPPPLPLTVRMLEGLGGALTLLPTSLTFPAANALGRFASRFFPREKQIAEAQLRYVTRVRPLDTDIEQTYRQCFGHIFQCVVELFFFARVVRRNPKEITRYIHEVGANTGQDVRDNVRAILAITAHLGNFELLAAYHSIVGNRVTVIGREPNYSALSIFVDRLRTAYGAQSIWRHGRAAASVILRALKEGRSLAVLLDQDTNLSNSFAPFFDLPAASPKAAIELAIRNKLPVITTFVVREGHLRFKIITEWVEYDPSDPNADQVILNTYNSRLEALILQYPEQWVWWHRRWRRRPEVDYSKESVRSTREYVAWLNKI